MSPWSYISQIIAKKIKSIVEPVKRDAWYDIAWRGVCGRNDYGWTGELLATL